MQLVLSGDRIIAHGENFLAMGGTVINTKTGAKHENATIAECNGCPSDIDKVGYEYHAGEFVPCAPYGVGNNNGYFMEVCADCATPRNSGIPIKNGLGYENLNAELKERLNSSLISLLWENADVDAAFDEQSITLSSGDWDFLIIEAKNSSGAIVSSKSCSLLDITEELSSRSVQVAYRQIEIESKTMVHFEKTRYARIDDTSSNETQVHCIPYRIYGVKL